MSTLAKNVSQVVLYENQVSDFVALLWMQTPLGSRTICSIHVFALYVGIEFVYFYSAVH